MRLVECLKDERSSSDFLERFVWRNGPICSHCGETKRLGRLNGETTAVGYWKCYACRKPFFARRRTPFHNSHVPLHVSLQLVYLLAATDAAISGDRLAAILGVASRSAWLAKRKLNDIWRARPPPCSPAVLSSQEIDLLTTTAEWQPSPCPEPSAVSCALRFERFKAAIAMTEPVALEQRFIARLQALIDIVPPCMASLAPVKREAIQLEFALEMRDGPV